VSTASCSRINRGGNLHTFLKLTLSCVCLDPNSYFPAVGRRYLCRSSVELLMRCSWTSQVRVFSEIYVRRWFVTECRSTAGS